MSSFFKVFKMAEACSSDKDPDHGRNLLKRYIKYAESAIQKCKSLSDINGAPKLERKCQSELKYLNSLSKRRGSCDEASVRSSNLSHYLGVLHAAENLAGVSHILQAFSCPGRREPLYADVVAGDGRIWVKVIARKAQALHLVWAGKGQYGERDLMLQAKEYVTCVKEHPVNFVEPKIIFAFYNGVTAGMAEATQALGIEVLGNVVKVDEGVAHMLKDLDLSNSESDDSSDDSSIDGHTMSYPKSHYSSEGGFCSGDGSGGIGARKANEYNSKCKTMGLPNNEESVNVYSDGLSRLSSQSSKSIEPSVIGTFNQERENNSTRNNDRYTGDRRETITYTTGSKEFQTTGHLGETNNPHLNKSNPQSSFGMALVNEVYTTERQFQAGIDAVPLQVRDVGIEQNTQPGIKNVSSTTQTTPTEEKNSGFGDNNRALCQTSHKHLTNTTCSVPVQINDNEVRENSLGLDEKGPGNLTSTTYPVTLQQRGVTLGQNNRTVYETGDTNETNPSDGELLMHPLIEYSRLCTLLTDSMDSSTDSICKVNLDVSSLITLVSAVTHGRCRFKFKENVLSEQAGDERREAVLPNLETFLEGKEMYACETAVNSFTSILDTLGGPGEVTRADYLLSQITKVPDNTSFRTQSLPNTGKIKDRSKVIFGTGDSLRAVTLTANSAFVRAAHHQGCVYAAHIHPARALTERKEETGVFLEEFNDVQYHRECALFTDVCPDINNTDTR